MLVSNDTEQSNEHPEQTSYGDSSIPEQHSAAPPLPARPHAINTTMFSSQYNQSSGSAEPEFENIEVPMSDAQMTTRQTSKGESFAPYNTHQPDLVSVTADNDDDLYESDLAPLANTLDDTESTSASDPAESQEQIISKELPSLETQREIILRLYQQDLLERKAGDSIFIVPNQWFAAFWSGNEPALFEDPYAYLGSIDVEPFFVDCDNFLFKDRSVLYPVCKSIIMKLAEWYGVQNNIACTYLIENPEYDPANDVPSAKLMVDWDWLDFYLFLFFEEAVQTMNKTPIRIRLSKALTIGSILEKCKAFLLDHENLQFEKAKTRFWLHLLDETTVSSNDLQEYSDNFVLLPPMFAKMKNKSPIKPKNCSQSLEALSSTQPLFIIAEIKQKEHWPSNYYIYNKPALATGTKGLNNLGNTCYMNSALQCLAHIPEFEEYFKDQCYKSELNLENPLGYEGKVATSFGELVSNLFSPNTPSVVAYTPRYFKSCIGYCNSMFQGYQQQDSQEFITFLLDGLHEDLNRVLKKPYVEKAELEPGFDINDSQLIEKLATKAWHDHKLRNDSIILDLFVGMYKSTLTCPSCNNVSLTFDPYNDLSLPLPVQSFWTTTVLIFPLNHFPIYMEVELDKKSVYQDLKQYVAKKLNRDPATLLGYECFNNQIYKSYDAPGSDASYLPLSDLIGTQDTAVFVEVAPMEKGDLLVPVFSTFREPDAAHGKFFGYPTFINFKKEENLSLGKIKYKILKTMENLTGLEICVPFDKSKNAETYSQYQAKTKALIENEHFELKAEDLGFFDKEYDFWKLEYNNFCKIKIISAPSANSTLDDDLYPEMWSPSNTFNPNDGTDLSSLTNPVLSSLYSGDGCSMTVDKLSLDSSGENEHDTNYTGSTLEKQNSHTLADASCDIAAEPEITGDGVANSAVRTSEPLETGSEITFRPIITGNAVIVVEWDNVSEATAQNFSWNHPKEFVNKELIETKEKRLADGQKTITLDACLEKFSKPEVLAASEAWYCPKCKKPTQAVKQIELWSTPDILLVHLKRFQNQSSFSDKISDTVEFPIDDFDISPYLAHLDPKTQHLYELFAVDNHYGGLGGGHYTAYVKNCVDNKWYYFNDSRVSEADPKDSIAGSAYLLFYRRKTSSLLGGETTRKLLEVGRKQAKDEHENFMKAQLKLYETTKSDLEEEFEESGDADGSSESEDDVASNGDEKGNSNAHNMDNEENIKNHHQVPILSERNILESSGVATDKANSEQPTNHTIGTPISLSSMDESSRNASSLELNNEVDIERRATNPLPVGNENGDTESSNNERRKIRLISKMSENE
ncbi:hypothetical protein ACO0RG_001761 [Hanseniaspora osmophila]